MGLVSRLADFKFQYSIAELSTLTDPKVGISIDGGTESIFTINKTTGFSDTYQNIADGQRTIKLKFYDGDVQKGKSQSAQESQLVDFGQNITMNIVPIYGKTTFSLTEETGNANFFFNIPGEVVTEAGGVANLQSLFSIVTPHITHEVDLTLDSSGDDYSANVTLGGFQYAQATLSLTFNGLAQSPKEILGNCTYDVTLDTNERTNSCDLTLRRRAVITGTLYNNVGVNVFNEVGEPVEGAVVYTNDGSSDVESGVTGSGSFGTKGYLDFLLKKGNYTIRAESGTRRGQADLSFDALDVKNLLITLNTVVFKSCQEILDNGQSSGNGVYEIDPDGIGDAATFEVYCDMVTDGGGWTLLMQTSSTSSYTYDHAVWTNTTAGSNAAGNPSLNQDYVSRAFYSLEGEESRISLRSDSNWNSWNHTKGTARDLANRPRMSSSATSSGTCTAQTNCGMEPIHAKPMGLQNAVSSTTASYWHRFGYVADNNSWGANVRIGWSADIDTSDSSDTIVGLGLKCIINCLDTNTTGGAHNRGSGFYLYIQMASTPLDDALQGWLWMR